MSLVVGFFALIGGMIGLGIAAGLTLYGAERMRRRLQSGRDHWSTRGKPRIRLSVDQVGRVLTPETVTRKVHVGIRGYNLFEYEYNYEWLALKRAVVGWCEVSGTPVPRVLMRYPGDTHINMVFERPDDAFAFKMRWL